MIVDFKEIPEAHIASGNQDRFELFSREFLKAMGYQIIQHPDRGADNGKDLLVSEILTGFNETYPVTWLVSAKHKAHSGKSVSPTDETNLGDRITTANADGFLGFYSTLPSTGLGANFAAQKNKNNFISHYDSASIERHLTTNRALDSVFRNFFPKSYTGFQSSGGYRNVELAFPVIDFKIITMPNEPIPSRDKLKITPLVTVHGERVLKNVRYSIEESKYVFTGHNPVLSKGQGEITLYMDTESSLMPFAFPIREDHFFSLHCLIASDIGTFSQNTTVNLSDGFRVMHSTISRGNKLLLTRHHNPDQTYQDQLHA